MTGIGIYCFLSLSLTFSKMCCEALNSYTKDNRKAALFYFFPFSMKKIVLNRQKCKRKKKNQCNIRLQIQCYLCWWVLGSSHGSGRHCSPQASLTPLCLPRLRPAELTAEPALRGSSLWEGAGGREEGRKERTPSAPCCKTPVSQSHIQVPLVFPQPPAAFTS